jgi:hypothetical protein
MSESLITRSRSRSHVTADDKSNSMSWCRAHTGTCDRILHPVGRLLSESCALVFVGRPLWREDWSAVRSAITQWSKSHRTRSYTLLSHLRLAQPGGAGALIYMLQEQGDPVLPPGTVLPFRRLLRHTGLWWRYSNPSPHHSSITQGGISVETWWQSSANSHGHEQMDINN